MISSLRNIILPPERELSLPQTASGRPCDGVIKNNGHTRNHAHPTACIWQCTTALLHPIIPETLSWGTLQQQQQETVGIELGVQNQLLTSLSFHDTVFFFSALSVRFLIQPVPLEETKTFEQAQ